MYTDYYSGCIYDKLMGFGFGLILLSLIFCVIVIIAQWKLFTKAGKPGWASIVPFYCSYVEFQIFWGNGWLFVLPFILTFLSGIPVIGIVLLVINVIIALLHQYKTAEAFGQGLGFTLGLIFLHPIFLCILAFGDYTYKGVPIDGASYNELKNKFDKVDEMSKNTAYEAPPKEKEKDIKFENPDDNLDDIIDAEPKKKN